MSKKIKPISNKSPIHLPESQKNRCSWSKGNELMMKYHDQEWGVAIHDDHLLFELLILEGAQAGLSWQTVLNKRENYRKAFD
jgi:DNA-3-methyladenine glycosylase I